MCEEHSAKRWGSAAPCPVAATRILSTTISIKEHHHDPGRMVALCATHHAKAGALTIEQCRKLKQSASERAESITGRFDWMRRDLVTVAGSVYYCETPVVLAARGQPLIWFTRDTDGYMLLSLDTPDAHGNQRVSLSETTG
jgi:hypothetical protein